MSASTAEISVIVASRHRRALLRRCLDSLLAQTLDPSEFEVIVADDGSGDGTAEMVRATAAPFALKALELGQVGKSTALNTALEAAEGSVCLFIDDDVIASPGLVEAHLAAHRSDPDALGIGAVTQQPPSARDWYAHTFAQGWNDHYERLGREPARWSDCYGANFSAPREKLRAVGGFATGLQTAEDLEIGFRLWQAGCTPVYLPRAHGVHDDQKGYRRMLADLERQGRAHVEIVERAPAMAPALLDWRGTSGELELNLRRALIHLRLSPRILVWLGWLVPQAGRKMIWLQFTRRFAFWRAVRKSVDRARWAELTTDS